MSFVPAALRKVVIVRAGNRCEYCGLPQAGQNATFHIDHIQPVVRGGTTTSSNLALACVACSLRKGPVVDALDPTSRKRVRLFHPRVDVWSQHFVWRDIVLAGRTAIGRATIALLRINSIPSLGVRSQEKELGRHPPPMP
jgi:hypothetical protein